MYWRIDPDRRYWVLRAHGVVVARVARDANRYVARVRFAGVDLLGVYARCDDAQRFAERELWSAAGEAIERKADEAATFTPCFSGPRQNQGGCTSAVDVEDGRGRINDRRPNR